MGISAIAPNCSLVLRDEPGVCGWCGDALTGRQTKWCGATCANQMGDNHWWTAARHVALIRAAGFTRIGVAMLWRTRIDWQKFITCDQCGRRRESFRDRFEVNHVEPRNGEGYGTGCWNHQTNLQVLCHACHVAETTRQTRERLGIPEAGRASGRIPPMDSLWEVAS